MTLLLLLLVLAGAALLAAGLWRLRQLRRVARWPSVPAQVIDLQVAALREPQVFIFVPVYQPVARYRYEVNGQRYESRRVCLDAQGARYYDRRDAQALADRIAADACAYHEPGNPAAAVLVRQVSGRRLSHYRALVSGGVIVLTAALVLGLVTAQGT